MRINAVLQQQDQRSESSSSSSSSSSGAASNSHRKGEYLPRIGDRGPSHSQASEALGNRAGRDRRAIVGVGWYTEEEERAMGNATSVPVYGDVHI